MSAVDPEYRKTQLGVVRYRLAHYVSQIEGQRQYLLRLGDIEDGAETLTMATAKLHEALAVLDADIDGEE